MAEERVMNRSPLRSAHLDEVYPLLDFEPTRGEGVWIEDTSGRRLLDFYGGHAVASVGYSHPKFNEALITQLGKVQFQSNLVPMKVRDEAADALAAFAPEGLDRVFFVNSGAEANENALKIAIRLTGRSKIIAIEHSFHGRTAAAAAVTWGAAKSWYGFPQLPMEVEFVPRNDVAALQAAVDTATAAVIIEPVQGVAGAFDFNEEFVSAVRKATADVGALMIMDEVQTGIGRLGEAFGAQLYGVLPDLLTSAKGLAGGMPAGAVIMGNDIASQLKPGDLATTFGGAPLACAAIKAVIEIIIEEDLLARVRACSAAIKDRCITGPVKGIQGRGLLLGLQ
ncbi:MAG: aminotransferase class III-fold pyridoxal phosphate-dependent enzyme, partial [Gammaproteobacteria bacterium]|nr:aminotransferase class III-fold pyridoxal phosphate-dependent enzyme [Gammaproteobacteria bacterium]